MTEQDRMTLLTKRCPKCGHTKSWAEFYVRERWPDGTVRNVQAYCCMCVLEAKREYNRRNAAVVSERSRQYRLANPEKVRASNARYRAAHREEARERGRQYRLANRDRLREQERRYREEHHDRVQESKRRYRERKRAEQRKPKVVVDEMPRLPLAPLREYLSGLLRVYEHHEIADMTGVSKRAIYRIFHETEQVQWDTADKLITKTGGVFALVYSDIYATGEEDLRGDLDSTLQG